MLIYRIAGQQKRFTIGVWPTWSVTAGIDLCGVFRRRELIPFVLVPQQVAAKHGSAEKLSLLKNLQQARDAFVFGATYAALALRVQL